MNHAFTLWPLRPTFGYSRLTFNIGWTIYDENVFGRIDYADNDLWIWWNESKCRVYNIT